MYKNIVARKDTLLFAVDITSKSTTTSSHEIKNNLELKKLIALRLTSDGGNIY